ncbi:uncharacterized protein LOC125093877 [Lutra lutra]|uniref:uncharacterized protein LOC125093877 n=1 Tax=Lutra lutra TaxID=9657 RepID=UPI001FD435D1|nr:uncharacterized protein LOC125093877 [Lutra lutra]
MFPLFPFTDWKLVCYQKDKGKSVLSSAGKMVQVSKVFVKGAQTSCVKLDRRATRSGLEEPAVPSGVFCTSARTGGDGLCLFSAVRRQASRLLMEGVLNGRCLRSFSSAARLDSPSRSLVSQGEDWDRRPGATRFSPKCDKLVSCGSVHLPVQTPPARILKAHERVSETQPRFHVPRVRSPLGVAASRRSGSGGRLGPAGLRAGLGLSRQPVGTSAGRFGHRRGGRRAGAGQDQPSRPPASAERLGLSGRDRAARDGRRGP